MRSAVTCVLLFSPSQTSASSLADFCLRTNDEKVTVPTSLTWHGRQTLRISSLASRETIRYVESSNSNLRRRANCALAHSLDEVGFRAQVRVFDISLATNPKLSSMTITPPAPHRPFQHHEEASACTAVYRCHTDRVKRIATEASSHVFLTCGEDGTVRYAIGANTDCTAGRLLIIYSAGTCLQATRHSRSPQLSDFALSSARRGRLSAPARFLPVPLALLALAVIASATPLCRGWHFTLRLSP